jgi:hypothetical protein
VYVADLRASDLTADQVDSLRLAGPDDGSVQAGFPVMDATFEGELVRLHVAEFATPDELYLWRLRQEPAFLITALRDGLAALKDAGLANLLARGEVGGVTGAEVVPPPGGRPLSRTPTMLAWARAFGWCGARRARGKPGCSGPPSATC